ncbi:hypothetical protein AMTRI_Chr12g273430 [Amborella trichopoda]
MRVQLHCIAIIHVVYLNQVDLFVLSWCNPLLAEPPPFLLGPQRQNVGLLAMDMINIDFKYCK